MKRSFIKAVCFSLLASSLLSTVKAASEPISASTTRSSLRVVGDTLYFLYRPPDKYRPSDFKDEKAIDTHYTALLAVLKKRNPVQDARFAFKHGMRYFLTFNGITIANLRSGVGGQNIESLKVCPQAHRYKRLEGMRFHEDGGTCHEGRPACFRYLSTVGSAYMLPWNREMTRLCNGGK